MRTVCLNLVGFAAVSGALAILHLPYIGLPYYWDEAGYYIPAAWDIYKSWNLVPTSTLPTGHTPLVMTYLAFAWPLFGYSQPVTRAAIILIAAATVLATLSLARRFLAREPAIWSAVLLALSSLFFAQSTMAFLDLPAALFTTLAVAALASDRIRWFALMASFAVLTKETTVVMLPVAWAYYWRVRTSRRTTLQETARDGMTQNKTSDWQWIFLLIPLVPLIGWTLYFHHKTGFWTGNAEYLQYNLFTTLDPMRFFWTLLRRLYQVFVAGFNWLVCLGAVAGWWWGRNHARGGTVSVDLVKRFNWLAGGLIAVYVFTLSLVGGAVLPRYLLPIFPATYVLWVGLIWRLPRVAARGLCGLASVCFVAAWFINPPYPFAFENNLAYADFIRLHQDAARYLESRPAGERILTAWPATDELSRPFLGYVRKPLRAVPMEGFTTKDFAKASPDSFDVLYLYSRKWEPGNNWLMRFPALRRAQERYFDYTPQVRDRLIVQPFGLTLLKEFKRRGQWVRIYEKQGAGTATCEADRGRM